MQGKKVYLGQKLQKPENEVLDFFLFCIEFDSYFQCSTEGNRKLP